jgi:hypothetical protein
MGYLSMFRRTVGLSRCRRIRDDRATVRTLNDAIAVAADALRTTTDPRSRAIAADALARRSDKETK